MRAPESPFECYMSERNLSFAYLIRPSFSGPEALKNVSVICHIQISVKSYWTFSKLDHWKNISKEKIRRHSFVVDVLIYALPKFGGNQTNSLWVLAFYSVHFKWKKMIRENSAEYVNQTSSFYFWPKLKIAISLPIFNLFQWFLFYIRDFIWIITLTKIWRKLLIWRYTVTLSPWQKAN